MREEFFTTKGGKRFVLYAGLLDEAHARGLKGIDADLVQVPAPENGRVAVVRATVEMEDGRTFSGIGDASPDNVGRAIVPHIIRQAETRAKARALRDAINVGATALEELSDGDEEHDARGKERGAERTRSSGRRERRSNAGVGAPPSEPRPVRAVEDLPAEGATRAADEDRPPTGEDRPPVGGLRQKADKGQVGLLRTLAVELRGEAGVERLESRMGKRLDELTKAEAAEWVDRLTPSEGIG